MARGSRRVRETGGFPGEGHCDCGRGGDVWVGVRGVGGGEVEMLRLGRAPGFGRGIWGHVMRVVRVAT